MVKAVAHVRLTSRAESKHRVSRPGTHHRAGECVRASLLLLNFQHPVQRYARPVLHVIGNFDLVNHISVHQIFQRPA